MPWRPRWSDIALAASLLVVALLSGLSVEQSGPGTVEPARWWQWLLLCLPPILVAFRHVNPTATVAIAAVIQPTIWATNLPSVLLPTFVLLYTACSAGGKRGVQTAIGASVILTVVTGLGLQLAEDVGFERLPLIALTCGTAVVLGIQAARRRAETSRLATQVAEEKLRAEHARQQAVSDERAHIGRELHDVIGHTLAVIAVRAEAAERVRPSQQIGRAHV